jgi:hypothetical protein
MIGDIPPDPDMFVTMIESDILPADSSMQRCRDVGMKPDLDAVSNSDPCNLQTATVTK